MIDVGCGDGVDAAAEVVSGDGVADFAGGDDADFVVG